MSEKDFIYACLGEWFDSPCNYTLGGLEVPEYMTERYPEWCNENCGSASPKECWKKFFEALREV